VYRVSTPWKCSIGLKFFLFDRTRLVVVSPKRWGHMVWGFGFGGQFKGRGPPPIPNTWGQKIENFFFVSIGLKMGFEVF